MSRQRLWSCLNSSIFLMIIVIHLYLCQKSLYAPLYFSLRKASMWFIFSLLFLQNTTSLKEVSAFYNMKLSLIIMMVLNSLFIIVTEKMLYEMELMIIEANLVWSDTTKRLRRAVVRNHASLKNFIISFNFPWIFMLSSFCPFELGQNGL